MTSIYITYWAVAILSSFLITYFTPTIHGLPLKKWRDFPWPLRMSQWILNFIGSLVGWIALAYFIFWRIHSFTTLEIGDFLVLIVAFYGITGYLPYILIQKGLPWK